jgi:hypothetical protein
VSLSNIYDTIFISLFGASAGEMAYAIELMVLVVTLAL